MVYALCQATRHRLAGPSVKAAWALHDVVGELMDKKMLSAKERQRAIRMLRHLRRQCRVSESRQLLSLALCRIGCKYGGRRLVSDFLGANSIQKMAMLSSLNRSNSRIGNRILCRITKTGAELWARISAATYLVLKGCDCGRVGLANAIRSDIGTDIDKSRLVFGMACTGDVEAGARLKQIVSTENNESILRMLYRLIRRYNRPSLPGWDALNLSRSKIEVRFPAWIAEESARESPK